MITITTNNHLREFQSAYDVPKSVLENQFDYLDNPDDCSFFQYKNHWYHLGEFMRINNNSELSDWDGYSNDSFFSGVLIRLKDEQYQIATYIQRG